MDWQTLASIYYVAGYVGRFVDVQLCPIPAAEESSWRDEQQW